MVLDDVPDTSAPMQVDCLQWTPTERRKEKANLAKAPKEKVSIQKVKMEKE